MVGNRWPGVEIWVTEYAYAHRPLADTQSFFNETLDYFDEEDHIGRYTYFGAFRSSASNVGQDAVFLNNDGDLTDLGAWYIGQDATGVDPRSGDETDSLAVRTVGVNLVSMVLGTAGLLATMTMMVR